LNTSQPLPSPVAAIETKTLLLQSFFSQPPKCTDVMQEARYILQAIEWTYEVVVFNCKAPLFTVNILPSSIALTCTGKDLHNFMMQKVCTLDKKCHYSCFLLYEADKIL
jgi:hypothetical protein